MSWLVNLNIASHKGVLELFSGGTSMLLKQAFEYIKFLLSKTCLDFNQICRVSRSNFTEFSVSTVSSYFTLRSARDRTAVKTLVI
jgi:hypothetical protein